jgi:hypothetical protein
MTYRVQEKIIDTVNCPKYKDNRYTSRRLRLKQFFHTNPLLKDAIKYHHNNLKLDENIPDESVSFKPLALFKPHERKKIIEDYYNASPQNKKKILEKYHLNPYRLKKWEKDFIILDKRDGVKVISLD